MLMLKLTEYYGTNSCGSLAANRLKSDRNNELKKEFSKIEETDVAFYRIHQIKI